MKHSCIYDCEVMHHRMKPKVHRFNYRTFMFCLDLDEIPEICRKIPWISHNKFNLFSFCEDAHLRIPESNGKSLKTKVLDYLGQQGIAKEQISRIVLLTNLKTLGYQFNPVSFYYCFDTENRPYCSIAEVCNTFGEMKLYLLRPETHQQQSFHSR